MASALLLSGLVAIVAIPSFVSRGPHARRALKRTVFLMLVFNLFYVGALWAYPRIVFR